MTDTPSPEGGPSNPERRRLPELLEGLGSRLDQLYEHILEGALSIEPAANLTRTGQSLADEALRKYLTCERVIKTSPHQESPTDNVTVRLGTGSLSGYKSSLSFNSNGDSAPVMTFTIERTRDREDMRSNRLVVIRNDEGLLVHLAGVETAKINELPEEVLADPDVSLLSGNALLTLDDSGLFYEPSHTATTEGSRHYYQDSLFDAKSGKNETGLGLLLLNEARNKFRFDLEDGVEDMLSTGLGSPKVPAESLALLPERSRIIDGGRRLEISERAEWGLLGLEDDVSTEGFSLSFFEVSVGESVAEHGVKSEDAELRQGVEFSMKIGKGANMIEVSYRQVAGVEAEVRIDSEHVNVMAAARYIRTAAHIAAAILLPQPHR